MIVANEKQRNLLVEHGFDVQTEVANLRAQFCAAAHEGARATPREVGESPLPSGRTTYRVYSDYQKDLRRSSRSTRTSSSRCSSRRPRSRAAR